MDASRTVTPQEANEIIESVPDKWDVRYLELARLVASWSKDPSTKTGAVLVRLDRTVASIGFNGFPKGMPDNSLLYDDRAEKYSRIVHCEMNALIHAREPVVGYTLYTWPFASCDRCAVHMLQAGVSRFVFPPLSAGAKARWSESLARAKAYVEESGRSWSEVDL